MLKLKISLIFTDNSRIQIERISRQIESINKEIAKVQSRFKSLYYDKVDGIITQDEFSVLNEDCKSKENSLQKQLNELNDEIERINQRQAHADNVKDIISEFKNIKKLDRYTVQTLIDYIEIGGNRTNRIIQIHWNF